MDAAERLFLQKSIGDTSVDEIVLAAGVATAPGLDFDRVNGQRFLRLSYAGTREGIEKALERMARFLQA